MGAFDFLSNVADYFDARLKAVKDEFVGSWHEFGQGWDNFWSGASNLATAPFGSHEDVGKSVRMFLDGVMGMGSGVLGETFGSAFQLPGLNEAGGLLNAAYRWGIARPVAASFMNFGRAMQASMFNPDGTPNKLPVLFNPQFWKTFLVPTIDPFAEHGAYSDEMGRVTPGQAVVWTVGGLVGMADPGNPQDPYAWMKAHDPRTPEGQATFNSDHSETLLKYLSGGIDVAANVIGDVGEIGAMGGKFAKSRALDKVATAKYIAKGGVTKEISSKAYDRTYQAFLDSKDWETARTRTMPHAALGGQAAAVLWVASRMGPDVYRQAYSVLRGVDAKMPGSETFTALKRLQAKAPNIVSDMSRLLANWNIGEEALSTLRGGTNHAVDSLMQNDVDAAVQAFEGYQGILGTAPGILTNEAMPRVSKVRDAVAGVHSWILTESPIMIGKPLKATMRTFAPSQGFTPFLDLEDPSKIGLRQFRSNLERSGMKQDRVSYWASAFALKQSREGRFAVMHAADNEAVALVGARHGMAPDEVKAALQTLNDFRHGSNQVLLRNQIYLAEQAARLGARNVVKGRPVESKQIRDLNKGIDRESRLGDFGKADFVIPDADGHPNSVAISDTRKLPGAAPDVGSPLLVSQTARLAVALDFRALDGMLKWHRWRNPEPRFFDPETKQWRAPENADELAAAKLSAGQRIRRPIGRAYRAVEASLTAMDFGNMIWKSSALLRPAQMPRSLADDVLRRALVFGKLPLIMSAMTGTRRAIQNVGLRGKLVTESVAEQRARRGAEGTRSVPATAEAEDLDGNVITDSYEDPLGYARINPADVNVPQGSDNVVGRAVADQFIDPGEAWKLGLITMDQLISTYRFMLGAGPGTDYLTRVPSPIRDAFNAENQRLYYVGMGSNPAAVAKALPTTAPFHLRALKRRIIEHFLTGNLEDHVDDMRMSVDPKIRNMGRTDWLDDMRVNDMLETRWQGTPYRFKADPRHSDRDVRKQYLNFLLNRHRVAKHGEAKGEDFAKGTVGAKYVPPRPKEPYRPGQLVVNPWTSMGVGPYKIEDFDLGKHVVLDVRSQIRGGKPTGIPLWGTVWDAKKPGMKAGTGPTHTLADFLTDNVDEFMRPDSALAMTVMPDGNIRVSVARLKKEARDDSRPPLTDNPMGSKWFRLRNFKFNGIVDSGHTDVTVQLPGGRKLVLAPSRAGEAGEPLQHRVSAVGGYGTYNYLLGDFNQSRIVDQMGGYGLVQPGARGYGRAWERAVNAQIAGDPVAQMVLQGKSDADIFTWLESTEEGTRWVHRMHFLGTNYIDHVRQIRAMVDNYVPYEDSAAGRKLRAAVLNRAASYNDLKRVKPNVAEQPEVHGSNISYLTGRGRVFDMVSRGIDGAQKLLSDLPTDKLSRFPFFDEAYKRHLTELVHAADATMPEMIPEKMLRNFEQQARARALHDTKYRLYDVAQTNDVSKLFRYIVPFASAINDSYLKYGRLVRDNPAIGLQGLYYWNMLNRNDVTQDENGNVLRMDNAGHEHWYSVEPKTGTMTEVTGDKVGQNRYVVFRFPEALSWVVGGSRKYYGVDAQPVVAINKNSFNVFLGLPSTGPLVAFPANEFALSHPEFGDSKLIQTFVMPFGPSASAAKSFVPSNIRSLWDQFQSQDGGTAESQAISVFQAELLAYNRGERDHPPSFAEARQRAASLKALRFMNTWFSPVSFGLQSPYQPYIDAYRQLQATDPQHADEIFDARYNGEMNAVAMAVTRNVAGLRATLKAEQGYQANKGLISKYPDLAGLIVGDQAGTFSKSVYEAQKQRLLDDGSGQHMREPLSLEQSVEQLQSSNTWDKYTKMMDVIQADMVDRGLTSLRQAGADDLVAMKDAFIQKNMYWQDPASGTQQLSPWYKDYMASDDAAMDDRVNKMAQIVKDPNLQKRDDIRGLIEYLVLRREIQARMAAAGVTNLDSNSASELRAMFDGRVSSLTETSPAFAQVYNRWLSRDTTLQLPVGYGGSQ